MDLFLIILEISLVFVDLIILLVALLFAFILIKNRSNPSYQDFSDNYLKCFSLLFVIESGSVAILETLEILNFRIPDLIIYILTEMNIIAF